MGKKPKVDKLLPTVAKNTYKTPKAAAAKRKIRFAVDKRLRIATGILLQALSLFLLFAFVSHLVHGQADQGVIEAAHKLGIKPASAEIQNWLGLLGAISAYYLMFRWLGITAFLLLPSLYLLGHRCLHGHPWRSISLSRTTVGACFGILWGNAALGYVDTVSHTPPAEALTGSIGIELGLLCHSLFGWGTILLLVASMLIFIVYYFNVTQLPRLLPKHTKPSIPVTTTPTPATADAAIANDEEPDPPTPPSFADIPLEIEDNSSSELLGDITPPQPSTPPAQLSENYDPTIDLSAYQYPTLDLLDEHHQAKVPVNTEELAQNKNKIIETLINFKVGIASIKATIGPTVTLYEIVPEAGVKISKIKNLEDDIALSLAALGIRIIAPIPGKGTIGIEVPNKNRQMVPLRDMMATEKFMQSSMDLPIIMGRTIANEGYVADLTRMPHLLIAGATGQGKSVGLNVVLASLVYKKHPSQLKLVLVDPKKVELSLYNKLERHFLAKLPGNDEPIITETKKVVHTLNSLCLEMDQRYELLKEAGVRNIKEYNDKFVKRRLNPEKGHHFLPYIVLVIDEFADMMMTAGKEVEAPIARLAQLARAIGIHLVLATQRPSVNVITGIIKANFPVRISYRVTSKIDSRTILDAGGAEQLVGRGDMLLSMNSEIIRLQCPYLDTEEVERICDHIGTQRGYESAYMLPAYDDELEDREDIDLSQKDPMFDEAAHLIVAHQQGSTSLIQRKLKLGYNRAGRLIDQLEAAGIVGPFEGSKAREVLISDEQSLGQILKNL